MSGSIVCVIDGALVRRMPRHGKTLAEDRAWAVGFTDGAIVASPYVIAVSVYVLPEDASELEKDHPRIALGGAS